MNKYDCIIIGAGVAGLSAANLLLKMGRRVIVADEKETPGGLAYVYKKEGYQFPNGPFLFLGFNQGLFPVIFSKTGVVPFQNNDPKLESIKPEDPVLQIVMPGERINLYSKREYLLEELNRVFPRKIDAIRLFYSKIDEIADISRSLFLPFYKNDMGFEKTLRIFNESFKKAFSIGKFWYEKASRFLYGYGLDIEFKRFIDMQTLLFSQKTTNKINLLTLAEILAFLKMDAVTIKNGFSTIAETMSYDFAKKGGDIRYNTKIAEVIGKNKMFRGVRLEEGAILEADYLIANIPDRYFHKDKGMDNEAVYTVYLGADEGVVPVAMKGNLVMSMDLSKYPFEENFIYASIVPENSRQPEGKTALKISMLCGRDVFSDKEKLLALKEEAMRQVKWLMPFSDNRLYFIGDNSGDYTEEQRYTGLFQAFKPFKPVRFYKGCYRSGLKHSYFLSDIAFPSAGIGRELFGAVSLSERIGKG